MEPNVMRRWSVNGFWTTGVSSQPNGPCTQDRLSKDSHHIADNQPGGLGHED